MRRQTLLAVFALYVSIYVAVPAQASQTWLQPFALDSIWRRLLDDSVTIDPNNDNRMAFFVANHLKSPSMILGAWGVAVQVIEGGEPTYTISSSTGWPNTINALGTVPIASGTLPDPRADAHLAIWDPVTHTEWDMWHASYDALTDSWSVGGGAAFSTDTDGIAPWNTVAATSANFPLLGGLLRPEDFDGEIEHALVFGVPNLGIGFVPPATHTGGSTSDPRRSTSPLALVEGKLIQLDPSLDVASLGLPEWEEKVARALQRYGAYVRDYAGTLTFFSENPINRTDDPWAARGFSSPNYAYFSSKFPWERLRILQPLEPSVPEFVPPAAPTGLRVLP